ncbi:MAG TPA: redox-regulated ATPase YchF [archaeon]|nr:redox-regulated ATPase YchF [archaeon]
MLIGVVGKPSAGKSTFFNAATSQDVPMASYPFTTIEANKAIGFVRIDCVDKEFNTQCNPRSGFCHNHIRYVPIELIDVAGLVPGAHEGKGRGNQFLSDLSRADVLIHVVDASGSINEKGEPVGAGNYDPIKDVEFLEEEINLWFFGILNKHWDKLSRTPYESKAKMLTALMQSLSGVGAKEAQLERTLNELSLIEKRLNQWTPEEKLGFVKKLRESSKPIIIAANKIDVPQAKENIEKMKSKFPKMKIIPCSGISELTLKRAMKEGSIEYYPGEKNFEVKKELNEKQQKGIDYIKQNVLEKFGSTGIQEVLEKAVFEELKYIAVFPGGTKSLADKDGNRLPDVFLMSPKSTALDFAFALHTDFGEKFIRAINVKNKLLIGRDYELKHRDVIEIVHGN